MELHKNQEISAKGYITDAKFLHGTVFDFETNLGYHHGRLKNGFFIAYLLRLPELDEFETAGYSITPEHRHEVPKDLDVMKLKKIAREAMSNIGSRNLVKVIPKERHNEFMDPDTQYPFGRGGIPQWKLVKELRMFVFQEIEANYEGYVYLHR
jgi:hypothetical protein